MKHASVIICAVVAALLFAGAASAQVVIPPGGSQFNPAAATAASAEHRAAGDSADGRPGEPELCARAAPILRRAHHRLSRPGRRQRARPKRACELFALLRQSVIARAIVDDDCRRPVRCGVTIDARHGTSDPDSSCPATKPTLTYDSDAAGSSDFTAVHLNRHRRSKRNR